MSSFFKIIILIKISRPWHRLLLSFYIYDLISMRDLWSLSPTESVDFTWLPGWLMEVSKFIFSILVKPHSALPKLPSTSSPATWTSWNIWNYCGVCSHHSLLLCSAIRKVEFTGWDLCRESRIMSQKFTERKHLIFLSSFPTWEKSLCFVDSSLYQI